MARMCPGSGNSTTFERIDEGMLVVLNIELPIEKIS